MLGGDLTAGPKVLVLTTFDLDEYVYEALRVGASGFLLKDSSGQQLAEAVRVVAAGDALLSPSVTRRLIAEFSRLGAPKGPTRQRIEQLTERETEVLALVARGRSNAETVSQAGRRAPGGPRRRSASACPGGRPGAGRRCGGRRTGDRRAAPAARA